jgi:hypothetical protein
MPTAVTITEQAIFTAFRSAIVNLSLPTLNPADAPLQVVRGQTNRVPEPTAKDWVEFWPLRRIRLATNIDNILDCQITASITANILTVTAVLHDGPIAAGQVISGAGITLGCYVVAQISGAPGGVGTYQVSPTSNVASGTLYLGTLAMIKKTDVVIQVDVHGPFSADNATAIETYFRDGAAVDAMLGTGVTPLYADDARQMAFLNAEDQFEERWSVDVHLQADPATIIPQYFIGALGMTVISVDTIPVA